MSVLTWPRKSRSGWGQRACGLMNTISLGGVSFNAESALEKGGVSDNANLVPMGMRNCSESWSETTATWGSVWAKQNEAR